MTTSTGTQYTPVDRLATNYTKSGYVPVDRLASNLPPPPSTLSKVGGFAKTVGVSLGKTALFTPQKIAELGITALGGTQEQAAASLKDTYGPLYNEPGTLKQDIARAAELPLLAVGGMAKGVNALTRGFLGKKALSQANIASARDKAYVASLGGAGTAAAVASSVAQGNDILSTETAKSALAGFGLGSSLRPLGSVAMKVLGTSPAKIAEKEVAKFRAGQVGKDVTPQTIYPDATKTDIPTPVGFSEQLNPITPPVAKASPIDLVTARGNIIPGEVPTPSGTLGQVKDAADPSNFNTAEEYLKAGVFSESRDSGVRNVIRKALSSQTKLQDIKNLKPNPNNPTLDKSTIKIRLEDIQEGKRPYVLIDEKGQIIDGHHTFEAYKQAGIKEIPVITRSQLTDQWNKAQVPPVPFVDAQGFRPVQPNEILPNGFTTKMNVATGEQMTNAPHKEIPTPVKPVITPEYQKKYEKALEEDPTFTKGETSNKDVIDAYARVKSEMGIDDLSDAIYGINGKKLPQDLPAPAAYNLIRTEELTTEQAYRLMNKQPLSKAGFDLQAAKIASGEVITDPLEKAQLVEVMLADASKKKGITAKSIKGFLDGIECK